VTSRSALRRRRPSRSRALVWLAFRPLVLPWTWIEMGSAPTLVWEVRSAGNALGREGREGDCGRTGGCAESGAQMPRRVNSLPRVGIRSWRVDLLRKPHSPIRHTLGAAAGLRGRERTASGVDGRPIRTGRIPASFRTTRVTH
jgi:hypothetical protein